MKKFSGKGVYGAIAVGKIALFRRNPVTVEKVSVEDTVLEIERFRKAKEEASRELQEIYEKALEEVGESNASIFEIHKMMLEDEDYNRSIESVIETQKVNSEYGVAVTSENFSKMFTSMDDEYMQARGADIKDISDRIIKCLNSAEKNDKDHTGSFIICADDLSPSETVLLDKDKILGFATAYGALNSHTAILARNMNIPGIIGLGQEFLNEISDGMECIADGYTGELILEPDNETKEKFLSRQADDREKRRLLEGLKGKENITLDGRKINIYANIGSLEDVDYVLSNDAGGIGLFRSEFLYLGKQDYPTEDEQFQAYKKVLETMAGKKVIIRTLDIGADKEADYFRMPKEENPALGCRGIRLCMKRPDIFRTQLRALYRASAFGDLGIMFPMITGVSEVEKILEICSDVRMELKEEGVDFSHNIQLGIMIETPAAAIISDRLAPMVDFFSVGTNDLTQYTFACDRQNPELEEFCDPHHEALLRLVRMSAENIHKHGGWIGICGELGSDLELTEKFLKMEIDELSVSPSLVLKIREKVRSIDLRA